MLQSIGANALALQHALFPGAFGQATVQHGQFDLHGECFIGLVGSWAYDAQRASASPVTQEGHFKGDHFLAQAVLNR